MASAFRGGNEFATEEESMKHDSAVVPANSYASPEARQLLAYIAGLPGRARNKVISGRRLGFGSARAGPRETALLI